MDVARTLRGRCAGRYAGRCADVAPDATPDVARKLRGNCAAVARLAALSFDKGMVSNEITGFQISESRQK